MTDDDALDEVMAMLRVEYLADAPARLAELDQHLEAWAGGGDAVLLHRSLHQLTGSAGSYGFPAISAAARRAEQLLKPLPTATPELLETVRTIRREIGEGFAAAG